MSNLPQMDVESLEDKLGFHFSKKANGGGEVTGCHVQEDAQVAELTFAEEGGESSAPPTRGGVGAAALTSRVSVLQSPTRWCSNRSTSWC